MALVIERYQHGKNRLWEGPHALINTAQYSEPMRKGFENTMELIRRALQKGNPFDSWFTRLKKGAIVRIVPLGTNVFQELIGYVFSPNNRQNIPVAARQDMERHLSTAYDTWANAPATTPPQFLCLQLEYVINDIVNFDVPVFYHQLNTSNVMDSWGTTITIPDTITIDGRQKPIRGLLNRAAYFSAPPLDEVQRVQLGDINHGNTSPTQVKVLLGQLQSGIESNKGVEMYNELVTNKLVDDL